MDLSFLRSLYAHPGPWASAYLDATPSTEDAARALALRWRGLRESLAAQGASAGVLVAMDHALDATPAEPDRLGTALFASEAAPDDVTVQRLPSPPRANLARYGALPHAMPLVAQRGEEVGWLRVVADRTGAEVSVFDAGGVRRSETVRGHESYPIQKTKPGGWSQARYQRDAETTWQRNAGDVAAATTDLADALGPDVLVLAGDVRARQLLLDRLPKRWQRRAVLTDAGVRASGADHEPLDEATTVAVAEVADRRTREAVDRFGAQEGLGNGLAAVVSALQREQVEAMLIVDDPSSTDELWIGPEAEQLALDPAELRDMGVQEPVLVRADAALVRAVAETGADLVLVGPDDTDLRRGVGAVLRYADAGTRQQRAG
ncbi:baeRF2 domain-containing protein [Phytohabitans kaempferiae]|uniref:Vms1/Ankzf1 family peptidyl-tRNA hydrolase n=1 Tax=Phytohabitans kaempferiae TaxID=1620943 RepID=A0ABV6MDC4_9ACTN